MALGWLLCVMVVCAWRGWAFACLQSLTGVRQPSELTLSLLSASLLRTSAAVFHFDATNPCLDSLHFTTAAPHKLQTHNKQAATEKPSAWNDSHQCLWLNKCSLFSFIGFFFQKINRLVSLRHLNKLILGYGCSWSQKSDCQLIKTPFAVGSRVFKYLITFVSELTKRYLQNRRNEPRVELGMWDQPVVIKRLSGFKKMQKRH